MKTFKLLFLALFLFSGSFTANLFGRQLLKVEYTKTNISCFGKTDGRIELAISGGKLPYAIKWNNGSDSTVLENLKHGEYIVTIADANGKEVAENILIEMPSPLTISYNSKKETLVDFVNGYMDAAISGGTPWELNNAPYYYIRLNDQSYVTNPWDVQDGVYKLKLEDANGCKLSIPVNLNFEVVEKNIILIKETDTFENKPYNGLGYINVKIYKPKNQNVVSSISNENSDK